MTISPNINRIQLLKDMLKKDPEDCFLNYGYALEVAKEGNTEEAITRLKQIIAGHPEYLPSYYQLGKMLEEKSDKSSALDIYQQGIELARLQQNFKTLGELEEAMYLLED